MSRHIPIPIRAIKWIFFASAALLSTHTNASNSCNAIITHGLRNIEVSKSSEASIATKYFNHCQKNFESMSDDMLVSVEVEVFGKGAGGGDFSRQRREQRLNEWCTTNKETAISNRTAYNESQVFYQGAISAWERCTALYAKDVRITPVITPDARTVNIGVVYGGNTKSGILLYGVRAENFTCDVTGPAGKVLKLPAEIQNQNWQVSCKRSSPAKTPRDGQEYMVLPRGTISIETASDPFQLFFAEEWDPGAPSREVAKLRLALKQAEVPVGTVVASTLTADQFMSPRNAQYSADKWLPADGRPLPPGSLLEQITGARNTPDWSTEQQGLILLDVVSVPKSHGENVVSAITDAGRKGEWKWHFGPRDVHGNRYNNDWEQDADHFQTFMDGNGTLIAQGRTLNFKHGQYGGWRAGSGNLLGISTQKRRVYYYVKIN